MPEPRPKDGSSAERPLTLRTVVTVALVAGAVSGGGAFALLRTIGGPTPPSAEQDVIPATATASRSSSLDTPALSEAVRDAFEMAEAERSQLAGTVLALSRRAEALEMRLTTLVAAPPVESTADSGLPSDESGGGVVVDEPTGDPGDDDRELGDEPPDSLVAAGVDPASAADIRRRRDEFQLARLELIDRATREGWADSDRLGDGLEELDERRPDLRDELGDDAYDRYLFEEGGRNRVGIASVISGSAADVAGLVPGDVLLSYAGARVFRSRELQAATRAGERGEYVQIGVLRGGEIVAVDVPRGPLGVTLEGLRRPPG